MTNRCRMKSPSKDRFSINHNPFYRKKLKCLVANEKATEEWQLRVDDRIDEKLLLNSRYDISQRSKKNRTHLKTI